MKQYISTLELYEKIKAIDLDMQKVKLQKLKIYKSIFFKKSGTESSRRVL